METGADFVFARMPEIHFGAGRLAELPQLIRKPACRIVLVTGSASFQRSGHYEKLTRELTQVGVHFFQVAVPGEPSPAFIDQTVARHRNEKLDWVISVGGGSAIDAGKALSAMLLQDDSVTAYLEGMETKNMTAERFRLSPFPRLPGRARRQPKMRY